MTRTGVLGIGRQVVLLTLAIFTAGSVSAFAAEHICGNVSIDVVDAPVAGGSNNDRCGTAWATCGTMILTVQNDPVVAVKRFVSERQRNGQYGPPVETDNCAQTFGACAWQGPPKIVQDGDMTTISQTLNNWTKKEQAGTWKRATLYAYCE